MWSCQCFNLSVVSSFWVRERSISVLLPMPAYRGQCLHYKPSTRAVLLPSGPPVLITVLCSCICASLAICVAPYLLYCCFKLPEEVHLLNCEYILFWGYFYGRASRCSVWCKWTKQEVQPRDHGKPVKTQFKGNPNLASLQGLLR